MSKPTITTTYAGESAKKYIAAQLLSGTTLNNGLVEILPNVRYKSVIQKVATSGIIKNSACDFDDQGTIAITERVLTTEEFMVNVKFCTKQFVDSWEAVEMGVSAFKNMPRSFSDFIIGQFAKEISASVETSIWTGTNATAGQVDGYQTLWKADGSVVSISGTTVTHANVITEMSKLIDNAPNTIYGKEDLIIYASTEVIQAYIRAMGGYAIGVGANGFENKGQMWYENGNQLTFDGVPIALAAGMESNSMALAQKSNLFFGTGLLDDLNEVRVIDTSETLGDRNARFVSRFAYGIQYGVSEEIVHYCAAC
jgi:hypothetical protein